MFKSWKTWAKNAAIIAGAVAAIGVLYNGIGVSVDKTAKFFDSGPVPLASREEVDKLRVTVNSLQTGVDKTIEYVDQQISETKVNRLTNLRNSLELQRVRYQQSGSEDDRQIMETLQMQLSVLQEQIQRDASK